MRPLISGQRILDIASSLGIGSQETPDNVVEISEFRSESSKKTNEIIDSQNSCKIFEFKSK